MMRISTAILIAAMLGLLGVSADAGAQQSVPTVAVSVQAGPAVRECVNDALLGRRCGDLGSREITVSWQASCGAGATANG